MYRKQIAMIFSHYGLNHLYEKFEVPLDIHGILINPDTCEILDQFLSVYDFHSSDSLLFDEFLSHYKIFQQMIKYNQALPLQYIDLYKPNDGIFL